MISIKNLSVHQGDFVLGNVSFDVPEGQYGILMGHTGCGKTTILEAVCGLRPVAGGTILLDGFDVTRSKPALRGIGYVPQDAALFSTMTVRAHLAFALKIRKWSRDQINVRVKELADLLNITHLLDRRPKGLSGGEQQRVSLGRALAFRPRVLCLDEPLSALDDQTRRQMYTLLKQAQKHEHVTVLHVTHSLEEASHLGDIIFRVENGMVRQVPRDEFENDHPRRKPNYLQTERSEEPPAANSPAISKTDSTTDSIVKSVTDSTAGFTGDPDRDAASEKNPGS